MRFENRVCIVTGGASGIGGAIVERLLSEGAFVAICDINLDPAEELIRRTNSADRTTTFKFDVADPVAFKQVADKVHADHGRLDVLFNNAGVPAVAQYDEMDRALFDKVFGINVFGIIAGTQAVVPHMKAQGGGSIVNTISTSAKQVEPQLGLYSASKFAALGITKSFAREFATIPIRVNGICPGMTVTPLWNTAFGVSADKIQGMADDLAKERNVPMGFASVPFDQAAAAVFLASDDARYITGETINIDGGWLS